MRLLLAFVPVLGLAVTALPSLADAQDVQVMAPSFEVGDEIVYTDGKIQYVSTTTSWTKSEHVVRSQVSGEVGQIQVYDHNLRALSTETEDGAARWELAPHNFKYDFPLSVGHKWSGRYEMTTVLKGEVREVVTTDIECAALCLERITVPAGTFDTFRIACSVNRTGSEPFQHVYWYAPSIGVSVLNRILATDTGALIDEYMVQSYRRSSIVEFDVLPDDVESTCEEAVSMNEPTALMQD